MFSTCVQPSTLSLFSSTATAPLQLFTSALDPSLPADSLIHLLHDSTSLPPPPPPALLISTPDSGHSLNQTVLHLQSPTLPTTFIHSPPQSHGAHSSSSATDLAIKHPWMHLQVRNIGRPWAFEVALVDQSGRTGILRFSTFQKRPRLRLPSSSGSWPLLHLPLAFPPPSSRPLTAWCTITLFLPSYLPYFSSPKLIPQQSTTERPSHSSLLRNPLPEGRYSHLAYVRIYACCRLRRIWFNQTGPAHNLPWEFELYGDQ